LPPIGLVHGDLGRGQAEDQSAFARVDVRQGEGVAQERCISCRVGAEDQHVGTGQHGGDHATSRTDADRDSFVAGSRVASAVNLIAANPRDNDCFSATVSLRCPRRRAGARAASGETVSDARRVFICCPSWASIASTKRCHRAAVQPTDYHRSTMLPALLPS
jgi:hypothetical protein